MLTVGEYAALARIDHYWIVDLDERSLTAHRLDGADYRVDPPAIGSFRADVPFPVTLELAAVG